MVSKRGGRPVFVPTLTRRCLSKSVTLATGWVLCVANALAGNWNIVPRVIGSETYTDNVTETHSNTQSDFITEFSPGINISGAGSRVKLNMDYQLQSLWFASNSGRNTINNDLAANGQAELVKDLFFVDSTASISQQTISAQQQVSLDNLTVSNNRAEVKTFSISPYLRHDFSGYASGTLRYSHDIVNFSNASAIENSDSNSVQGALKSGRHNGPLGWNLNYNDQRIQRGDGVNNARYKNMDGEVRYALTPKLGSVVQGGREENDYPSLQPIVNGNYWGAGLDWTPSHYIKLRGLEGSRYKTATVTLTPNVRTDLTATYRNREVGLNPGPAWSGNLTHRTIHTVWEMGYLEDTVTTPQLAQQQVKICRRDPVTSELQCQDTNGNFVPAGSPDIAIFDLFSLTNEVNARQRASAAVSYTRRKSTIRLSVFDERRVYQLSLQEERTRGADITWALQLTPRSESLLTVGSQRNRVEPVSQQNEYYFVQMGLMHELSRSISGNLEYRFFNQTSDGLATDYRENRLTARVTARF